MTTSAVHLSGTTPLMKQFYEIKAKHPDKILFFRMGDFYEMFGDDAVKAAPILGISLTSRSHGTGERIPLAGVPHHAGERYLSKLMAAGVKVVIVEQVEDPKKAKGLVKRDIVEILTPGTSTIESASSPTVPTCLAALAGHNNSKLGMALLDLSTGQFTIDEGDASEIIENLRVVEPAEVLFSRSKKREEVANLLGLSQDNSVLTECAEYDFSYETATRELNDHFGTATLEGFGIRDQKLAVEAAGAIFRYLRENHRDQLRHINRLRRSDKSDRMSLDYNTVRNLELVRSIADGSEKNSLISVVDRCNTPAGTRRLRNSLLRPFCTKEPIERRLTGVAELVKNRELCFQIRQLTKKLPDLERLSGRLGIGRLSPRQASAIKTALAISDQLAELLKESHSPHLQRLQSAIPNTKELVNRIETALVDEPPLVASKGNILRRGYSEKLDYLNDSIRDAREYISSLQKLERERTGINSLKVGYNKVFGYYLEVTKTNIDQVPSDYIRKQTLVNAERYITEDLKTKEELILAAEDRIFRLEEELFLSLVEEIADQITNILAAADILSELDLVSGLAELAVELGYQRPELFEDNRLLIENGRHPVIESVLPTGSFVTNDTTFDHEGKCIVILTGPNMSGKSTYLRQIGLIVILAQIGSFVPAERAEIGIVDRVFTRVGALDNLARGQSTFLVEMVETANILNNATDRSLVLLDEVGRGTSTFDGMSVAWAVVEHIEAALKCRTIFATHYHELTGMADSYDSIRNCQVAVKKWENQVIFLHKIVDGGCDDSYGIEVARLAGLPKSLINRAKRILQLLESGKFDRSNLGMKAYSENVQPTLFDPVPSKTEERLREVDINEVTPVQAFDLLRSLKEELDS